MDTEQFAAYLLTQGRTVETTRVYANMFRRWCAWASEHGHDPLVPTRAAVWQWGQTLRQSQGILYAARGMLRGLCDALEHEHVHEVVEVPRVYRGLPDDTARQLHDHATRCGLKGLALLVALHTPADPEEVATLAWHRVDLATLTLELRRPSGESRHVEMPRCLADELHARRTGADLWVFPSGHNHGHHSTPTVWRWMREVADGAGLDQLTRARLRHTILDPLPDGSRHPDAPQRRHTLRAS